MKHFRIQPGFKINFLRENGVLVWDNWLGFWEQCQNNAKFLIKILFILKETIFFLNKKKKKFASHKQWQAFNKKEHTQTNL